MAWSWVLQSVPTTVTGTNETGGTAQVDPTLAGQFVVVVRVRDDANTVVMDRTYTFPHTVDNNAAIAQINADVARLRDARARRASLAAQVGFVSTVP